MLWTMLLPAVLAQARPISPDHDGNCQAPVWSPTGDRLAYEVNDHDARLISLYLYTPGQEPTPVLPPQQSNAMASGFSTAGAAPLVHDAVWSPPALSTFVYTASGGDEDYDLYLYGAGELIDAPGADGGPTWSADGRFVVFTSARTGQGDLYRLDTADVTRPPLRITASPASAELYAAFAPDSRGLAYVGHTDAGDQIFYMEDVTDPRASTLVAFGRTQTRPRFSPDGLRVAFYSDHNEPGRFDLYTIELKSRDVQLIDEAVVLNHRGPTWTPDSSRLVYVRDDADQLDPVWSAPVAAPSQRAPLETGTIGNRDLDLTVGSDGRVWMAVAAQGATGDTRRDYHRIFVAPVRLP